MVPMVPRKEGQKRPGPNCPDGTKKTRSQLSTRKKE